MFCSVKKQMLLNVYRCDGWCLPKEVLFALEMINKNAGQIPVTPRGYRGHVSKFGVFRNHHSCFVIETFGILYLEVDGLSIPS